MSAGPAYWRQEGVSAGGTHDAEDTSVTEIGGEVLVQASALEIARGEVLAGRYQIEAVLGRGGSGIVLRAFDRVARVAVAVKILKPELATDPRWVERFSRELRLARQIQHPHVCRVFDIGQADGHWFITMELATGGTLRKQLAPDAAPRPLEERLADVRAVVDGLAAIHEAGIVHRDVKPDNFLRMDDGRLVLSDFGLATNPADAPAVSIMVGTPHYMAPEVVMGEVATQRSDVWSAGVVVHEILCGERPPRSLPGRRTRTPVTKTSPRSPVLEASAAALAEDPELRPASAIVLRTLVEEAIASPSRFSARMRRRGRATLVWGAIALATFGLIAALGKRMWQPVRASSTGAVAIGEITSVGTPRDWSVGAKVIATFDERVHCFNILPGGEKARAIWGTPRRTEDIDLSTGVRAPSKLLAETYQFGCPELSPSGATLLYTRVSPNATREIMRADTDGKNAEVITSGAEPRWLPNGDEFAYELADAHAAVFSFPTMKYNIVATDPNATLLPLYLTATSTQGGLLGLVFEGDDLHRLLEVHSLPDLRVLARWQLPRTMRTLTFFGDTPILSNANGNVLEKLDLRRGVSERIGSLPSGVIQSVSALAGGSRLLLSRARRHDVWMFAPGESPRPLTSDGHSFAPTWSSAGGLLFERELSDGRYVIVSTNNAGTTDQVTAGPLDGVPAFVPGTNRWVYSDYHRKTIMSCRGRNCTELLRREEVVEYPVMAPDERHVAFFSLIGVPHLHVIDTAGRTERDLGPTAIECAPVWAGPDLLWVLSGAEGQREWHEIVVSSGRRTGRKKAAASFNPDEQKCVGDDEPPTSSFYRRVRTVVQERWQALQTGPLVGLDSPN
jgi:serine/threonine protein kinase